MSFLINICTISSSFFATVVAMHANCLVLVSSGLSCQSNYCNFVGFSESERDETIYRVHSNIYLFTKTVNL